MKGKIKYYFKSSDRRKILDRLLKQYQHYYQGSVLDIGGKDRGKFDKPKTEVEEWLFADISDEFHPDFITDITDMNNIPDNRFDVVNATEVFEHVEFPEKGLSECHRILKPGGVLVVSAPFMHPIHGDPSDFQRWTQYKWKNELERAGFSVEIMITMGRFFTVMTGMTKIFVNTIPFKPAQWLFYPLYPTLNLIKHLDRLSIIKKSGLGNFTTGYFIIAQK